MMGVLIRRDTETRDTPREGGHVKMEPETRVKPVQAKGLQGCCNHQPPARGEERFLPGALREPGPAGTLISDSILYQCEKINVRCFKPLSLWYFVMSAQGNKCSMLNKSNSLLLLNKYLLSPYHVPATLTMSRWGHILYMFPQTSFSTLAVQL